MNFNQKITINLMNLLYNIKKNDIINTSNTKNLFVKKCALPLL